MEISIEDKLKQELGYGSDLIIDEVDKRSLDALPQIQKMKILDDRKHKRDELKKRYEFIHRRNISEKPT
jgi:hypothetical protein